jgi:hypothetical protein
LPPLELKEPENPLRLCQEADLERLLGHMQHLLSLQDINNNNHLMYELERESHPTNQVTNRVGSHSNRNNSNSNKLRRMELRLLN